MTSAWPTSPRCSCTRGRWTAASSSSAVTPRGSWRRRTAGPASAATPIPTSAPPSASRSLTEILPFPSTATIAAFGEALGGGAALPSRNAIDVVGDLPTARTVTQMADGLAVLLRDIADPEQQIDVIGEGTPIVIRQTNLDDSITATIYVIATSPAARRPERHPGQPPPGVRRLWPGHDDARRPNRLRLTLTSGSWSHVRPGSGRQRVLRRDRRRRERVARSWP